MSIFRLVFILASCLISLSAFAVPYAWTNTTYCNQGIPCSAPSSVGWSQAGAFVCSHIVQSGWVYSAGSAPEPDAATGSFPCNKVRTSDGYSAVGNYTLIRLNILTCPDGQELVNGQCQQTMCGGIANSTKTVNLTSGYMRSRGDATYPTFLPSGALAPKGYMGYPPPSVCHLGCRGTFSKLVDSWSSLEPTATGLYRISDDVEYVFANSSCSATDADNAIVGSTFTAPPCTGFLGSINGKPACVATVPDMSTGTPLGAKIGNPKAGALGGGGAPDNIPVVGDGSNAGGPATSKDGGYLKPDDTIVDPPPDPADPPADPPTNPASAAETPDPCGAPGQPECGVKVNEKGTPDGGDLDYPATLDGVKSAKEAGLSRMSGGGDAGGLFGSFDTFFHAPSMATCEPVVLPAFKGASMGSIDPCPVVDGVRTVMGYLWALGGLFLCLGMVRQTVQGG